MQKWTFLALITAGALALATQSKEVEITDTLSGQQIRYTLRATKKSDDPIFGYATCFKGLALSREAYRQRLEGTREAINQDDFIRTVATHGTGEQVTKVSVSAVHLDTLHGPETRWVLIAEYGDRGETLFEACRD